MLSLIICLMNPLVSATKICDENLRPIGKNTYFVAFVNNRCFYLITTLFKNSQ